MRLWHEDILRGLPQAQLLGLHREVCGLRGNAWGRSHSTVNYIWKYDFERLVAYHIKVMEEMIDRDFNVTDKWFEYDYRGKNCGRKKDISKERVEEFLDKKVFPEHNDKYLKECIDNLYEKGCVCRFVEKVLEVNFDSEQSKGL